MDSRLPPSPNKRSRSVFGVALVAALLSGVSAFAQGTDPGNASRKLQDVERNIETQERESARQRARADKLKAELNAVTAELIQAARRVQDQEALVAELEDELRRLEREAGVKAQQLRTRRQQFSGVVMALTRIARFPTEALIAQPIPPEDTVRSAILLRAAVPAIETRAAALKDELQALAYARAQVEQQRAELNGAAERLRAEEARIDAIRKQKAALRAEAISKSRAAQSRARQLAREAKNLRDLVERLETERKKAEAAAQAAAKTPSQLHVQPQGPVPTGPAASDPGVADAVQLGGLGSIAKARGHLPFPAVGRLVGLYGQPLDGGLTRKGLSIETRMGAQVIAPFDGKVVFSGPFRGYGQLLIIDHGEGYHSLLAGLGHIDAAMGQPVLAGEPVARMASEAASESAAPVLYVEFRRDNQPINPLPWLASRKGTPQG